MDMPPSYNPIVRTYGEFRAVLLSSLDLDRRDIHPSADLRDLIPPSRRREIWGRLRRQGFQLPPLHLPPRTFAHATFWVIKTAAALALWLGHWGALLIAVPLAHLAYRICRPWAVELPPSPRTVGEMVFYLTNFREHRDSGYRWTRNDIALKVRLIVAEAAGLPLDKVRPDSTWAELGLD
jgi:hypothetical protein